MQRTREQRVTQWKMHRGDDDELLQEFGPYREGNGAPSKGFKQGRNLIRKAETLLPVKVLGQWEETLAPDLEPERPAGRSVHTEGGAWALAMVGRQGDPKDVGFCVGEGEKLLVQKANRAPAPRSGSSVRWELCLMQVHIGWGCMHSAFLERQFPPKLEVAVGPDIMTAQQCQY